MRQMSLGVPVGILMEATFYADQFKCEGSRHHVAHGHIISTALRGSMDVLPQNRRLGNPEGPRKFTCPSHRPYTH